MNKLSEKVLLALARYYFHRKRYRSVEEAKRRWTIEPAVLWDKDADLRILDKALDKGVGVVGYCASAGTFWFTVRTPCYEIYIECDEDNYLDGGCLVKSRRKRK